MTSPGRTATTRRPFVLVTGGKGGVGKSTLAANLGVELARTGSRPLLADLDFGLANLDVFLGLEPRDRVAELLGGRELSACLATGPEGLSVLTAGSGSPPSASPDDARRRRLLSCILEEPAPCDLVLGDSAAGIGGDVLGFATAADRVLVVTTPDPAALTDAYAVVKAVDFQARREGLEVPTPELFVNLAADASEARSVAEKLRAVCTRFLARSPRFVGWMPASRVVREASADQRPFVVGEPDAQPSRSLRQLARRFSNLGTAAEGQGRPRAKGPSCHVR